MLMHPCYNRCIRRVRASRNGWRRRMAVRSVRTFAPRLPLRPPRYSPVPERPPPSPSCGLAPPPIPPPPSSPRTCRACSAASAAVCAKAGSASRIMLVVGGGGRGAVAAAAGRAKADSVRIASTSTAEPRSMESAMFCDRICWASRIMLAVGGGGRGTVAAAAGRKTSGPCFGDGSLRTSS